MVIDVDVVNMEQGRRGFDVQTAKIKRDDYVIGRSRYREIMFKKNLKKIFIGSSFRERYHDTYLHVCAVRVICMHLRSTPCMM